MACRHLIKRYKTILFGESRIDESEAGWTEMRIIRLETLKRLGLRFHQGSSQWIFFHEREQGIALHPVKSSNLEKPYIIMSTAEVGKHKIE